MQAGVYHFEHNKQELETTFYRALRHLENHTHLGHQKMSTFDNDHCICHYQLITPYSRSFNIKVIYLKIDNNKDMRIGKAKENKNLRINL